MIHYMLEVGGESFILCVDANTPRNASLLRTSRLE